MADPNTTKAAEDLRAALAAIGRKLKIVAVLGFLGGLTVGVAVTAAYFDLVVNLCH